MAFFAVFERKKIAIFVTKTPIIHLKMQISKIDTKNFFSFGFVYIVSNFRPYPLKTKGEDIKIRCMTFAKKR